jgi:hypothetical protein
MPMNHVDSPISEIVSGARSADTRTSTAASPFDYDLDSGAGNVVDDPANMAPASSTSVSILRTALSFRPRSA